MQKWWKQNEKWIAALGAGLAGYSVLAQQFSDTLPQIPEMVSKSLVGQISAVTIAAALSIYAAYLLIIKY